MRTAREVFEAEIAPGMSPAELIAAAKEAEAAATTTTNPDTAASELEYAARLRQLAAAKTH